MSTRPAIGILGMMLTAIAIPAFAQDAGKPAEPKLDPKACADSDRLTEGDTHESQDKGTTGSDLSDKLARSDGVICPPPDVDPEIRAPAPGGGRTPVIPPPSERDPGTEAK